VGASERTVCYDCGRIKEDKRIKGFHRPYEIVPDPTRCLLEQGIVCAGPATRGGCGAPCTSVNMPCRGCYGPPPNVIDQGGKLLSALASIVDTQDPDEIERVVDTLPDLLGVCYLFGLPASMLRRVRQTGSLSFDRATAE
jgi:F420-non-reducing hydrogenase small subunit